MNPKFAGTLLAVVALGFASPKSHAVCDYGPDKCLGGFVWRDALAGDHVCVPGATHTQASNDNSLANQRRASMGGPQGPDTCSAGFVWREASPADHVCVPAATGMQAAADNAQASARRDAQCANPGQTDTSAPRFIQNTITFVRVPDNLQVGSEIIPPAGLTKSSVARDHRFVIAASAGDNESGIASISVQGGTSWSCTAGLEASPPLCKGQ
jgi:hypothetical protein